jgi:hypothetical protein
VKRKPNLTISTSTRGKEEITDIVTYGKAVKINGKVYKKGDNLPSDVTVKWR